MNKKLILSIVLLLSATTAVFALKVPELDGPVVDKAGVISSRDEAVIEEMIMDLQTKTTAQIAVLTVPDLSGESPEDFSLAVAEEWELGQAGKDNGVLILLALKEKKVRIEVGYGLEADLTDAKSGYIIREIMLPAFRDGNYAQGLYDGAAAAGGIILKTADISADEIASSQAAAERKSSSSSGAGIPFNIIIFLVIVVLSSLSRMGRRGRYGRRGSIWPWFFLGSMMGSGRRYDRHDGFGGGGFSGGGGFGGFSGGGGGFGGGGASGGW